MQVWLRSSLSIELSELCEHGVTFSVVCAIVRVLGRVWETPTRVVARILRSGAGRCLTMVDACTRVASCLTLCQEKNYVDDYDS